MLAWFLLVAGTVEVGRELPAAVRDDVAAPFLQASDAADFDAGVGNVPLTRALIGPLEVAALPDEGFIVRSGVVDGRRVLAGDGRGRGKAYAAYAVLERLGFRWLHPLEPPLRVAASAGDVDDTETARFRVRNIHLHTMHPLELTDLLEGVGDDVTWRAQLPEWDSFLSWLVANRQNEVEWVLLDTDLAKDDARRIARLRTLVDRAHAFGVDAGIDVPIAMIQQHAWRLMRQPASSLDEQRAEIDARLDWLFGAGFDFVSTESGDTELTHPSPVRMLAWMNEVASHAASLGRHARIKVHCSAGQSASPFLDRHSGEGLDFNFLPTHADPRLGIEPHTVQMYALDDGAPLYGNRDFRAMRRFLEESAGGAREVVWYPESAYWVSVDVDVPLFLPVYAQARLHDLDLVDAAGVDGQSLFSSGWEWGYWLNDVVAARAAWRRPASLESAVAALLGADVAREVAAVADDEHRLLVNTNGIAWLSGRDAFDEMLETQPRRPPVDHAARALLDDVDHALSARVVALRRLQGGGGDGAARSMGVAAEPSVAEIADALEVTALRARHVRALTGGDVDGARAARAQALPIVRRREAAYRAPLARIASFTGGPTSYPFRYLYTVHDLFYWRRDEETFARAPWLSCHDNIVDPVDVVFGPSLLARGARQARAFLTSMPFDSLHDLGACIAAPESAP